MKKLLAAILIIVVLLVAAVVALPFMIPVDTLRDQAIAAVKENTGRDLTIGGGMSLSLFPSIALAADDVRLSNAPGAEVLDMVSVKQIRLELQLLPLIGGTVRLDRLVLVEPVIDLEILPDGKANWQMGKVSASEGSEDKQDDRDAGDAGGEAGELPEINLGDVRLVNGSLTYNDRSTGQKVALGAINVDVSLPDLDSPFALNGAVDYRGRTVTLNISSPSLRPLIEGGRSDFVIDKKSDLFSADFKGGVSRKDGMTIDGTVDMKIESVRDLVAWLGTDLQIGGKDALGAFALAGKISATPGRMRFSDARIAIDRIKGMGELAADMTGKVPAVSGRLDIETLDIRPYQGGDGAAAEGGGTAKDDGKPADWSDEPIDLSGLKAANADFTVTAGAIITNTVRIGQTALTLRLKDGVMKLDLPKMALYDGQGKGALTVDGRKLPAIRANLDITGVSLAGLLKDAAGFARLEGTGRIVAAITTKGGSERQLVQNLNGKGRFAFTDGAILGFNLAAMVRNVTDAFSGGGSKTAKTDFSELTGSFTIRNGILNNPDLIMKSPLLRVSGKGDVDLPARSMKYRVEPKAVASLEGQGGKTDVGGIMVPVIIEGKWENLSFRPDLAGAIGAAVKDPKALLEKAAGAGKIKKKVGGSLGKALKGALSAPSATDGGSAKKKNALPDPGKALKGLLGN